MKPGGFSRQWTRGEVEWCHHPRGAWGGSWGGPWEGQRGRPGPPPWMAGLFGLAQGMQPRGPRVRRGDVRSAILDVLTVEPMNGYQIIGQIGERSGGAWRPSPGSVYPTISQLEDEGLITSDGEQGRRTLRLTAEGEAYVAEHAEELAAVWIAFAEPAEETSDFATLKPEIAAVMNAVWQIISTGSDAQRRAAVEVLIETRRKLYGLLADGDPE